MIETRKKGLRVKDTPRARRTASSKKTARKRLPLRYQQRQVLLEFLNHDFSRPLKYDRTAGFIDANGRQVSGELHMIIHSDLGSGSLEHLESIRQGFIAVLLPIADQLQGFKQKRINECLLSLTAKLNQMRFEPVFKVLAGENKTARRMLSRDQRIFSRGSAEWIITMDFTAGTSYSPERDFYGMIAEGLMNGELDLLRRCPYCQQFFTAKERRQIFCIPQHGRLYYDDPVRATPRVYQSRDSSLIDGG
jgi:hypothetical protein